MTDPITRLNAALEGRYRIERKLWSSSRGGGELEQLMEEVPGLTMNQGEGSWSLDGRYFDGRWIAHSSRETAEPTTRHGALTAHLRDELGFHGDTR